MTPLILILLLFLTTPVFAESLCITDPPAPDDRFMQQLCYDILVGAPAIAQARNQRWADIDGTSVDQRERERLWQIVQAQRLAEAQRRQQAQDRYVAQFEAWAYRAAPSDPSSRFDSDPGVIPYTTFSSRDPGYLYTPYGMYIPY